MSSGDEEAVGNADPSMVDASERAVLAASSKLSVSISDNAFGKKELEVN
jgi:hypothetical protein